MFSCHHKPMKIFLIALSFPSEYKQKAFDICALADYYRNYYQGNEDSQDKSHQWTSKNTRWFIAGKRCCFSHGIGHQPTTYFANTSHKETGLQHLIPLSVWAGNFKALCLADDWIPAPTEHCHNRQQPTEQHSWEAICIWSFHRVLSFISNQTCCHWRCLMTEIGK